MAEGYHAWLARGAWCGAAGERTAQPAGPRRWYGPVVDPETHRRYLDYRDRHAYFGGTTPILARDAFLAADEEHRLLDEKGERRDDDEEARFEELSKLLLRD